ncbi:hypothetical protein HH214_08480 [Mucilaginibacter robiniae]|uniref:PH domain-containing protein n=1 Tax=Mucilaginibacter robiniae TaxID=2728022 RepID=A0A7L5E0L2_9SPHI|nr:hypothetical protein [Mucilaginibacter robiniae]QJD95907.1 hypothetical protein HH214_08480 [Mucilaginibacter robiniae]
MEKYEAYENDGSSTLRYCLLGLMLFADVVLIISTGPEAIFYLLGFNVLLIALKPWHYKISTVSIDNQLIHITKQNLYLGPKQYSFELGKIDFIYKNRPIATRRQGFSSSNTGNVLTVFYEEHPLFDLTPDENGWTAIKIEILAIQLKQSGIKQVFEKFGTDDVTL